LEAVVSISIADDVPDALEHLPHDQPVLREFVDAVRPHVDCLRENVKVKWLKLLNNASDKGKSQGKRRTKNPRS
jgi:hypothetical protein